MAEFATSNTKEERTTVGIDGYVILKKAIEKRNLDKIEKLVTPSGLANFDHYDGLTNIVDISLHVSFDLKKASRKTDIKELQTLGDTVEDFACHLLEYSKKFTPDTFTDKEDFRDCIRKFSDKALEFKAKKFIEGPTVRECQERLWYRTHDHKMYTSRFWLIKSHVLLVFEAFLFPVIFLVLFIHHYLCEKFRKRLVPDDPIEKLPDKIQTKFRLDIEEEQFSRTIKTIKQLKQYYEDKQYDDDMAMIDNCFKDPYESYMEHFVTPYFIFVRDILSLLTLLVLHAFVCAHPNSLEFSALEWVIMVFFIGRALLVIELALLIKKLLFLEADRWNCVMEIGTVIIYLAIFFLRFAKWGSCSDISSNKCLLAASYMYGINAMFLTWRVFSQTMEFKKSTGIKQIALRKILKNVIVIFIQLLGALVAFTFVFTAIYVAEKSYDAKLNVRIDGVCVTEDGFLCAFHFFEFLAWSVAGLADSELLTVKDDFSKYFVKVLYLLFLMVAGVIIVNMLIALLSNTYQKVEDNAFHEWSYKRAVTIKKYSSCHPVTVPFNIITLPLYYCYKKFRCQNEQNDNGEEAERKKKKDLEVNEYKQLMRNIAKEGFRDDVINSGIDRINNVDSTKLQDIKNVIEQLQHDMAEKQKEMCETIARQQKETVEMCDQILGCLKKSVHDDNHTD